MLVPADSRPFFEPCGKPGLLLCHLSFWIWNVVPFLQLTIGTCGNILAIVVLSRRKLRHISTSVYLIFLACSDLTLLWTATLRETLMFVFQFDIHSVSTFHCVAIYWLMYLSSSLSVWTLVLLTMERVLFTKFPIFAKQNITRRTALIASTALLLIVASLNSHVLFGQRLQETSTSNNTTALKCTASDESYARFAVKVWPYIMFCNYSLLPVIIIFSGNMIVLYSLRQRRKIRTHQQDNQNAGHINKMNKEARTTRLLFILSFFYLVTTTPFMMFGIVYSNIYKSLDNWQFAGIQFTYAIMKVLIYSNFTFNFFFYFINGSLFKQEWNRLMDGIRGRLCGSVGRRHNHVGSVTVTRS